MNFPLPTTPLAPTRGTFVLIHTHRQRGGICIDACASDYGRWAGGGKNTYQRWGGNGLENNSFTPITDSMNVERLLPPPMQWGGWCEWLSEMGRGDKKTNTAPLYE